jgi:hypothetical protein
MPEAVPYLFGGLFEEPLDLVMASWNAWPPVQTRRPIVRRDTRHSDRTGQFRDR